MADGTPSFGTADPAVHNPLTYPRRILLEVFRDVFQQETFPEFAARPNPFRLVLTPSNEITDDSKLVIADSFSSEVFKTDGRPAIILSRGTFSFNDLAINGKGFGGAVPRTTVGSTGQRVFGTTGRSKAEFQDNTTVPISINCYARNDLNAELLAWLAGSFIRFHEKEIRDGSRIHKIDSPIIGEARSVRADSQHDLFVAPITLVVHQTLNWVKSTTATYATAAGISNLSGSGYPEPAGDGLGCVKAAPTSIINGSPEDLLDQWYGTSP